jgi:hypothetical protein
MKGRTGGRKTGRRGWEKGEKGWEKGEKGENEETKKLDFLSPKNDLK